MADLTLADGTVLWAKRGRIYCKGKSPMPYQAHPSNLHTFLTAEVAAREKAEDEAKAAKERMWECGKQADALAAQVEVLREALERIVMIEEAYHRGTAETGHIASQALASPSPAVEELKKRHEAIGMERAAKETLQKMAAIQAERRAMIQDEAIKAFTHCPTCGGDLDTGWECTQCQADWEVVVAAIKGEAAPASPCREDLVEALAAYAHEAWSGWMRYLFKKCLEDSTGRAYEIPLWAVRRWQRQMTTAYADLPEDEKESDRVEARKMLAIMGASPCRESGEGDALDTLRTIIGKLWEWHRANYKLAFPITPKEWGELERILDSAVPILSAQPPASDTEPKRINPADPWGPPLPEASEITTPEEMLSASDTADLPEECRPMVRIQGAYRRALRVVEDMRWPMVEAVLRDLFPEERDFLDPEERVELASDTEEISNARPADRTSVSSVQEDDVRGVDEPARETAEDHSTRRPRIGLWLRRARLEAGLSLREVSAGLGISIVRLGEIEREVNASDTEGSADESTVESLLNFARELAGRGNEKQNRGFLWEIIGGMEDRVTDALAMLPEHDASIAAEAHRTTNEAWHAALDGREQDVLAPEALQSIYDRDQRIAAEARRATAEEILFDVETMARDYHDAGHTMSWEKVPAGEGRRCAPRPRRLSRGDAQ